MELLSSKGSKIRLPTIEQIKIEQYRRSNVRFLNAEVDIEDKTSLTGITRFNTWPKQDEVLEKLKTKQFLIILKARQLGLTWLVLADTMHEMLFKPGYTAILISKRDQPDCIIIGRRMRLMLRRMAPWIIREFKKGDDRSWHGPVWEATAHEITIHRPGGEDSIFLALPASPDTAHSFTANRVILDEWALHPWAEEIWTGAYPTMNRPGFSGQVIGLSTGRRSTMFEDIWVAAMKGENSFSPIFLNWRADPRRDEAWYRQTIKNLPKTYRSQYPTNPADAFTVGEGAFFEEWDEEVHVVPFFSPPKEWKRIIAYDPAYNQSCWKWYAIRPDGSMVCYREYYPSKTVDVKQALEVVRLSKYEDGTQEAIEHIVADTDAWTKSRDSGKSTVERCLEVFKNKDRKYDHEPVRYDFIYATKTLEGGWRRLHEWLEPYLDRDGENFTALLTFTQNCANSRRTYPSCECSKANPDDIDKSSEHHCADVDRYAVMSRPEPAKAPKPPGPPPGSIAYMRQAQATEKKKMKQYSRKSRKDIRPWAILVPKQ